jgi:superfamily I DNA and/or RNA helicase
MTAAVQSLANDLVYCGALRAAGADVAARSLPRALAAGVLAALPPWLAAALDPARTLILLDTSGGAAPDARAGGGGVANAGEAALVGAVARGLLAGGLAPDDALAVSPYRAQVAALAAAAAAGGWGGVECLTIDKCQGRDRDAVLLSLARSNPARDPGRPLADWRRVNVACTRARAKLVIVADASTVSAVPALAALVAAATAGGWRVVVPPGAAAEAGDWFREGGGGGGAA